MWIFQLATENEGELNIVDPLLDTEEKAKERAISDFVNNSYVKSEIAFRTYLDRKSVV